jgi:hypothetical protein
MTALMSAGVRAGAEVVLIQEPSVKEEEDRWKAKIKDGNYIYIYSDDVKKPYVITAVRKDTKWTDYGGSRSPERVGIDINSTRIINIYHHRDQRLDSGKIREELEGGGQRKWVCAGDFNSHHSIWDGDGREPSGSWREVKEIIDGGRLMIEPGTPTWKGGHSHRSSTIDLVIASNSAQVSMVEIATDLYTGSDHETLCWEINDGGNDKWETHTVATPRWKIRKPVKNDEKNEEEEWRQEWMNRICPDGQPSLHSPLDQLSVFKGFLDDIFGRKRWSPRAKRWWPKELEEERDILAEARRTPPSSDQFKQARNRWLRAIRTAKRECWERFIQASDPGMVWRTSIAWLKERISQHFTIAKDSETDKGKDTITPPVPKKSFLDRASNRLPRTVAQILTGHLLCAPYLKRVRKIGKNRYRINAGDVASIECPVPTSFSGARKDFWDRPDEDGKIRKRPTSVGQLLGKSKWEKPLADWITATGVGLVGQDRVDKEDERVERNDGWRREPFL